MTDLNECGNRVNNFYPFGIEAQDTLFNISLNHSSDLMQNLNVSPFYEVFVSLICNYVLCRIGFILIDTNHVNQIYVAQGFIQDFSLGETGLVREGGMGVMRNPRFPPV